MRTDELDYELPEQLIADRPAERRDAARLLVTPVDGGAVSHRCVSDLPNLLRAGDLLVLNDTRVLPAKFDATRAATGGHVEGLFIETRNDATWLVMLKSGGRLRPGERIAFDNDHALELLDQQPDGAWLAAKRSPLDTQALLDRVGAMPVPPYIRKKRGDADCDALDRERYQTVYANQPGAVAAPTAGLHFTDALLAALRGAGVELAYVTLHVGLGTFAPVRVDELNDHDMHTERFSVRPQTMRAIQQAKAEGRRVIAVGTTTVRALESLPDKPPAEGYTGATDLLIQPGYTFRWVDGLMTNFHLPRSTLLALVAALTGLDRLMSVYRVAIAERYRFYSYGDAMLVV